MEEQTVAKSLAPKSVPAFPDTPAEEYLDFDLLRAEGLEHIRDLSGKIWTDHNVHDPGITILEELSYALTDLGYRLHLPDEDLLAPDPKKQKDHGDDNFFSAAEILTCNPLTILDWRKLLLDVRGVQNAWLEPVETRFAVKAPYLPLSNELWNAEAKVFADLTAGQLTFNPSGYAYGNRENPSDAPPYPLGIRGVYKVLLELEPPVSGATDTCDPAAGDPVGDTLAEVNRRLWSYRNLCEDFLPVQVLADEPVSLCAEIEIDANAQPDDVLLAIFERLQEFFSPAVQFYTLRELLDGKTKLGEKRSVEEAFEGRPLLIEGHGFIDTAELEQIERRSTIHVTDVYRLILGEGPEKGMPPIAGVSAIQNLRLINQRTDQSSTGEEWLLPLTDGYRPVLAARESVNSVTFYKRGIPYKANIERVLARFEKRITNPTKVFRPTSNKPGEPTPPEFNLPIPTGIFRPDLGDYYSIQRDFPRVYGVGEGTLTDTMPPERWYQALQLKGYLLFYDHMLANFLVQMSNIRSYFSMDVDRQKGFGKTTGNLNTVPLLAAVLPFFENSGDVAQESPLAAQMLHSMKENAAQVKKAPLASATKSYSTPQDRDHAIAQVVAAFDNGSIRISTQYDGSKDLHFLVHTAAGNRSVVMRSAGGFATEQIALQEAASWNFIGSLPSSYQKTDDARQHRYAFRLLNNPPRYQDYLNGLEESDDAYFRKKNLFMDHLLHRFAEDFTDYTLLMFAMAKTTGGSDSGQLALNKRFVSDKARFLSNYPDISRNRSKGRTATDWLGNNKSGLENRVGNLIGIETKEDTQTLNFFETLPQEPGSTFEIRDRDGATVLLRGIRRFTDTGAARKAQEEALACAADPNNYQAVECLVEQVYGFKLLNNRGCPIAEHPETFGSALRRDQKMRYVAGLIGGQGIVSGFEADTQGSFFEIFNEDKELILRAAAAAADEPAALKRFLTFAEQAAAEDNWHDIDDPVHRGYSFAVYGHEHPDAARGSKIPLAVHPVFYQSPATRNNHRDKIKTFVQERRIGWKAVLQPARYRWQICDDEGVPLLESLHFFRKKRQTAKAVQEALSAILQRSGAATIEIADLGIAGWTFYVLQNTIYLEDNDHDGIEHQVSLRIAAAPAPFVSRMACEAAVRHLKEAAIALDDCDWTLYQSKTLTAEMVWEKLTTPGGSARLIPDKPRYRLLWLNEQGKTGLLGDKNDFESRLDALVSVFQSGEPDAAGSRSVTDLATDLNAYFDISENEDCAFSFGIAEEHVEARAEHPDLFVHKSERTQAVAALRQEALLDAWPLTINRVIESFAFEVWWESCDGRLEIVLRGAQKFVADPVTHTLPQNARDAYGRLLEEADQELTAAGNDLDKETNFETFGSGKAFSFRINTLENGKKIVLADHVRTYRTLAEARRARRELLDYLTKRRNIAAFYQLADKICACSMEDGSPRDTDAYNWRLADEEDRVARYAQLFPSEPEARECLGKQIVRCGVCSKPDFSTVWENDDSVVQDGNGGGYRFVVRDATESYWQSTLVFDSESEARSALDAALIGIMDAARDLTRYHVRQKTEEVSGNNPSHKMAGHNQFFVIELMPVSGTAALAESVGKPLLPQHISGLTARLHRHALQFPFTTDADGKSVRFQIFNLPRQRIEWQSSASFADKSTAEAVFRRFLDLLKDESHYRLSEDCGKGWTIELVETLLQGLELFHTKTGSDLELAKTRPALLPALEKAATHFAWQRVDGFLDQLMRAGEGAFVPTVDYLNSCGYGFALAGEHYRLARHTTSYHTRAERERARDRLFGWWNCPDTAEVEATGAVEHILLCRKAGFFDMLELKCTLKGPDKRVYKQTLYKNRLYADQGKKNLLYEYPEVFAEAVEIDASGNISPVENAKNDARLDAIREQERLTAEAGELLKGLTGSEILENLTVLTDFEETGQPAPNDRQLVLQIAVNRPDGTLLAIIREWTATDPNAMKSEIKALYCRAMRSNTVELPDGKFGFEFRRPIRAVRRYVRGFVDPQNGIQVGFAVPEFEVVWENIRLFDTWSEAEAEAEIVRRMLYQKASYGRSVDAFGSPSLEIVNPDAMLATHRRTYATREARDLAWQKVQRYIHTEGMHLVEHIFLRPRHQSDDAFLPIEPDDEDIRDFTTDPLSDPYSAAQYVEGADPYSFIATIVLPAWSRRLRDLDFRNFFESTLRREAPAHVSLRLYWLRPEAMYHFERQYRSWLKIAGMPDHADYTCRKNCLIHALGELLNAFPDAVLTGCETGTATNSGGSVVLDKTTLN
jgi:hypothetical protein